MSATLDKTHKVSKGDTLSGIAKKYGHKDWKTIWKAPQNRGIVSKRGNPESIQPGDILIIPPSEKETKELEQRINYLHIARNADLNLIDVLRNEAARLQGKITLFDELMADDAESTKAIVKELEKNLRGMKNWAEGVDAVAALTQMGASLHKLSKDGLKAATVASKTLEESHKALIKEGASLIVKDAAQSEAMKTLASIKNSAAPILAGIGTIVDSWSKMTSPSFWAQTYVQMVHNKKSWSDAVSMEIGADIEEQRQQAIATGNKTQARLKKIQNDFRAQLAEVQKQIKETEARMKANEREAADLL